MSVRSILIGLVIGLGVACFGYYNDVILSSSPMAGDLMPLAPYAMLVIGLLIVNPLLGLLRLRLMSGGEWTVSLSLAMACVLMQGPGLTWTFSHTLLMPQSMAIDNAAWRAKGVVTCVGPDMLVDLQGRPDIVLGGWRTGLGDGRSLIHPASVPWAAWSGPLITYLPLLAMGVLGSVCLALILHRQWSRHERLSYPIAELTNLLLDRGDSNDAPPNTARRWWPRSGPPSLLPRPRLWPSVFYNRYFWLAFAPVVVIHLLNGANKWSPSTFFIEIPLRIDILNDCKQLWPRVEDVPTHHGLLTPTLYFTIVALAYFVSREVSLTVGLSPIIGGVLGAALIRSGVMVSEGDYLSGHMQAWYTFGAFVGLAALVLYTGRAYYVSLLRQSVAPRNLGLGVDRGEVLALRLMVLLGVGMVAYMTWRTPLPWTLATAFVVLAGIAVLVVARTSVETGLYFIQPGWHPAGVLLGALGVAALGPPAVGALMLLTVVLALDPRISMLPLTISALKISERQGLSAPGIGGSMAVAGVLGILAAVGGTLLLQYSFGEGNFWWGAQPPKMAFAAVERTIASVGEGNVLRDFQTSLIQPNPRFVAASLAGLGGVLLLSVLRLRLPWWPLHPVLLIVWVSFPAGLVWVSFLIGWAAKTVIVRLGGSPAYQQYKPFFVGLIAADLTAGAFWGLFGPIYTLITKYAGVAVSIRP